jgi:hypothetical protein
LSDVLGVPRPDGLSFVEHLVLDADFLDLLLLWLFPVLVFDLPDLGLLLAALFLVIFLLRDG